VPRDYLTAAEPRGRSSPRLMDEAAASMVSVLQGLATAGIWFLIV
jgi:hypothetical protein